MPVRIRRSIILVTRFAHANDAMQLRLSNSTRSTPRRITGTSPSLHALKIPPTSFPPPATVHDSRRATCYLQTLKYKQAIADFKKLLTLEPQNQLVRMQLDSTQKILRKVEFEKVRCVVYLALQ